MKSESQATPSVGPRPNAHVPEISIIVPVYKVEKYLRECLDSIKAQTFTDWECILVDDGSPDSSPAICDEYAQADSRFKVIHQANGGRSAARNAGLKAAQGKYLGFIDSDDWAEPKLYERLHELAQEHNADMVQVGYHKNFNGLSYPKRRVKRLQVLSQEETAREFLRCKSIPSYLWNKLIRREVVNSQFPIGKNYEDVCVFNHWMANIHKSVLCPDMLYNYRCHSGSLVRTKDPKDKKAYYDIFLERILLFEKLIPSLLTPEQRHRILWQAFMGQAKSTARIKSMPIEERLKALLQIEKEAIEIAGEPHQEILGAKRFKRIRTLRENPNKFISKALFTQNINVWSSKILPF